MHKHRKSRPLPSQAKRKLTLHESVLSVHRRALHSTFPSLNLQGPQRCRRCDSSVQPPALSCSTRAPAVPAGVPILSPQTSPRMNVPEDSRKNIWEIKDTVFNKVKATQSFRAIPEPPQGRKGWDTSATEQVQRHPGPAWRLLIVRHSLEMFQMLCLKGFGSFGVAEHPQGCSPLKKALNQVPRNSRNQQMFLRSESRGIYSALSRYRHKAHHQQSSVPFGLEPKLL